VREKLVYASNGTLSDDRLSLATDIQGIRDQLMNLANTTDGNGRFIFAGYKTESAPFDAATGDYNGGAEAITQQVDTARNMTISHTGQQIFESITSNAEAAGRWIWPDEHVQNPGFCYRVAEDAD
jgi:flagellar hook-associated protein 3 FlgL